MLSIEELTQEISSVKQQSQQLAAAVGAANQELGRHRAQIAGLVRGSRTGEDAVRAVQSASQALAKAGMSITALDRSCDACIQNLRK